MKDLMNFINPVPVIAPAVNTNADTALVGSIVNRQGFESVTYVIQTGTLSDTDATFTVLLEEGDNSSLTDAAAVADADLLGTEVLAAFTYAGDGVCRKLGYIGSKQYTRLTITPSGNNSGSAPISAVCLLGHPNQAPTANPPA